MPGELVFERYDVDNAPEQVKSLINKNINRETTLLVEDQENVWIVLTRGEKRTGGYEVRVSDVNLEPQDNGKNRLIISCRYNDPPPGVMLTQALTYPVEVILLKGLSQKPDSVQFVRL